MTRPIYEPSLQRTDRKLGFSADQLFRRPGVGPVGDTAIYEIKVFSDITVVSTGDDLFVWEIPEDLDGASVVKVEAYISVAGADDLVVQIRAGDPCDAGADILTTPITIDSGECNSKDASVQPVIDGGAFAVSWGDHLHIDVDQDGSGAIGLGVIVALAPSALASVVLTGAEGPAGPTGPAGDNMVVVRLNDGGSDFGPEPRLNFIEGTGITITVADDPGDSEVDVTIDAVGGGGGLFDAYALLQHQETSNTNGGSSTSGSWQTRTLNTEVFDPDGIVSLSSSQFTLAAGTYYFEAYSTTYLANARSQCRIRNVTDSSDVSYGSSEYTPTVSGNAPTTKSVLKGRVTIAGSKAFELQYRVQASEATDGLGVADNFGTEVYAEVAIWREA